MKEVGGGLWLGGLGAGALFGLVPAVVLFLLGTIIFLCELGKERQAARQAEEQAESWRKNYPSYKY